jgi:uncharacterized protein (DUF433 family)
VEKDIVTIDPDILGGTPVFRGTRVPIKYLFDFLEIGDTIDEFLENYPTVKREQVVSLLHSVRDKVIESADSK